MKNICSLSLLFFGLFLPAYTAAQTGAELQVKTDIVEIQLENHAERTWIDPNTKLMWAGKDNGSNVTWQQAADYCKNLRLGGYSNWRLPELSELATMHDPEYSRSRKHVIGDIRITGVGYWSNTPGSDSERAMDFVFGVGLRHDNSRNDSEGLRALCVRPSQE